MTPIVVLLSILALASSAATKSDASVNSVDNRAESFRSRILGGWQATTNQIPWLVWIRANEGWGDFMWFSGSIISSKWILTDAFSVSIQSDSSFTIGAGSNNLNTPLVTLTTTSFVVYPGYVGESGFHPLALLQLPYALPISANIAPIRLPSVSQTKATFLNYQGTTAGFGHTSTDSGVMSSSLQLVNMRVIDDEICKIFFYSEWVARNGFCAEGWSHADQSALEGDDGAPLTISEDNTNTLIGVTTGSRLGRPTAYMRVSKYLAWISYVTEIPLRP